MTEHIKIETADHVTTLTINRPDKKNAITQAMYGQMADAVNAYAIEDKARAFVFTGAGDMFTAGNDLQDFSTADRSEEEPHVTRFLKAILACPKPLIVAVNGPAIGVGLTMLLHCDLVYAGESATFNAPFVKLGLVPEAGSSILLPEAVGMAVANDILLGGRILTAEEAVRFGLAARVIPDAELAETVHRIALGVAAAAPTAMRKSKHLIRNQHERIAEQMQAEGILFVEQLKSSEFSESVAAMMQKRAPVYG